MISVWYKLSVLIVTTFVNYTSDYMYHVVVFSSKHCHLIWKLSHNIHVRPFCECIYKTDLKTSERRVITLLKKRVIPQNYWKISREWDLKITKTPSRRSRTLTCTWPIYLSPLKENDLWSLKSWWSLSAKGNTII